MLLGCALWTLCLLLVPQTGGHERPAIPRFRACHFVHDYHSAFGFIIGDVTSPSLRAIHTSKVLQISGGRRVCGRAVVLILKVRVGFRASVSSNLIIHHEFKVLMLSWPPKTSVLQKNLDTVLC